MGRCRGRRWDLLIFSSALNLLGPETCGLLLTRPLLRHAEFIRGSGCDVGGCHKETVLKNETASAVSKKARKKTTAYLRLSAQNREISRSLEVMKLTQATYIN